MKNIKKNKLVALILMLFPIIALIGAIIYISELMKGKYSKLELIIVILTIPFGFIPAIFLWLNALGVVNL